jgi:hypothetical protein
MTTLLAVVSVFLTTSAAGQEAVLGILNSGHAVDRLDATLAFYRDVFGLAADPSRREILRSRR